MSEVVARSGDNMDSLVKKVKLATILGTFQSTLTDFPYLRKIWTKNTEEERLLGVSITGILDCTLLNNPNDKTLPERLEKLKEIAVETNKVFAEQIGIPQSVAVTCVNV